MKRRSLAILVSETATVFSAPDASTSASRGRLRLERIGGRVDLDAGLLREEGAHVLGELGMCVQPGADGGAAERDPTDAPQRRAHALDPLAHLRRIAPELLPERHGHGVHPGASGPT